MGSGCHALFATMPSVSFLIVSHHRHRPLRTSVAVLGLTLSLGPFTILLHENGLATMSLQDCAIPDWQTHTCTVGDIGLAAVYNGN